MSEDSMEYVGDALDERPAECVAEEARSYSDGSYEIIGAMMRVHTELGPGWEEVDYHRCALIDLQKNGFSVQSKVRGTLRYQGTRIKNFELDMLVNDSIVTEFKNARRGFVPAHSLQLINYLTYWRKRTGLLFNFAQESLRVRRLKLTDTRPQIVGATRSEASSATTEVAHAVTQVLTPIVDAGLFTFDLRCIRRIFLLESKHQGLQCQPLVASPSFDGCILPRRQLDAFLFGQSHVVLLAANADGPAPQDEARLRAYVRHGRSTGGVLVNFACAQISVSTPS